MNVRLKKLCDSAITPTLGSIDAAGHDIYANVNCTEPVAIEPHATVMISTGLAMEIPIGYAGLIYPRSGLASKRGLRLANCVGVIDSDYRGEIKVALYNDSNATQYVAHGDRIAQMVISPYLRGVVFDEVDELTDTERGSGGFGHTGK